MVGRLGNVVRLIDGLRIVLALDLRLRVVGLLRLRVVGRLGEVLVLRDVLGVVEKLSGDLWRAAESADWQNGWKQRCLVQIQTVFSEFIYKEELIAFSSSR